jgi:tRNA (guanine37-N1)-methyltransferase
MKFDIITIFPETINEYFSQGLIGRAQKDNLLKIKAHNLRQWTSDRHQTVDDKPYGGGNGMVLKVEPIFRAVKELKARKKNVKTILLSPRGRQFNQSLAQEYSKLDHLIIISGRYEGVDERVAEHIADQEVSVGPYVLMSGDLPAMTIVESVARLKAGVAGDKDWLEERMTAAGFWENACYTRPEVFSPRPGEKWSVPNELLRGNHKEIKAWQKKHGGRIERG